MRVPALSLFCFLAAATFGGDAPVDIPQLSVSPTCDGSIAAGEYAGAFTLVLDGLTPSANPGWNPYNANSFSTDNLSYTFYVAHDGAALYVAFDITDNSASSTRFPNPNMGNVSVWEDDCTEVFIDGDFDRDDPSEGSGPGQGTSDRAWAEGMIPHAGIPNGTYWDNGFNFYNSGWVARSTIVSPTRWQAEYRIPFTAVDTLDGTGFVPLAVGDTIGFNLLVNDADFGNARTHQLAWNGITHNDQLYRQQQAWVPVRIVPRATSESWELR